MSTCVCGHDREQHNGPQYSTGLATQGPGCDECGCAYFAPTGHVHDDLTSGLTDEQLIDLRESLGIHPDAVGVTGYAWTRRMEPDAELHPWRRSVRFETCSECGHGLRFVVCRRCNCNRKDHDHRQRRARAELKRRKGKVEKVCPVCAGSRQYTDPQGVNPFRECVRCKGWGRVWQAKRKAKR